jgi:hypothetical protein
MTLKQVEKSLGRKLTPSEKWQFMKDNGITKRGSK